MSGNSIPSLLLVSALLFTILIGYAFYLLLWTPVLERKRAQIRRGAQRFTRWQVPDKPADWAKDFSGMILRLYSKQQLDAMRFFHISPDGFAYLQVLAIIIAIAMVIPVSAMHTGKNIPVLLIVAGYFLPPRVLVSMHRKKQKVVREDLPAFIGFFRMYVKVGSTNVPVALKAITKRMKGALADELKLLNVGIEQNQRVRDALDEFARRLAMPEVKRFTQALASAEEHGELMELFDNQIEAIKAIKAARRDEQMKKLPLLMIVPAMLPVIAILGLFMLTMGSQFFTQFGPVLGS